MALSHIGMKALTTTVGGNPRADACNLFYDEALKDTYREHGWAFATVKDQFAMPSVEVVGWNYVYAYPPKAAIVRYVFDESNVDLKYKQEFEVVYIPAQNKKVVCSDLAEAYIEYTYIVEDATIFDSKFTLALSYKLAAMMAQTLTTDTQVGPNAMQNFQMIVAEAKRINFQEKIKRPTTESEIVNVR